MILPSLSLRPIELPMTYSVSVGWPALGGACYGRNVFARFLGKLGIERHEMRQQGKMRFHSSFRSIASVLEKCPASSLSNGRWPGRLSRCIVIDASSAMWRWVNRCERMRSSCFSTRLAPAVASSLDGSHAGFASEAPEGAGGGAISAWCRRSSRAAAACDARYHPRR